MPRFYAATSGLIPDGFTGELEVGEFTIIPRIWNVTIWDWAELAAHHKLHMPFAIADSLAKSCSLEFALNTLAVSDVENTLMSLHLMLYVHGLHPFSVQLLSSHSINQYAAINSRKSSYGLEKLPEDLRTGIRTTDTSVEVWPAPYVSGAQIESDDLPRKITPDLFISAVEDAGKWRQLREANKTCLFLEKVALTAPILPQPELSLLHIWTGLEAVFPNVQTEVSFRLALYLAQLHSVRGDRMPFFQSAKSSYGDRSKIAHGGALKPAARIARWLQAWTLLTETIRAILTRGTIPSEEDLVLELLQASDQVT